MPVREFEPQPLLAPYIRSVVYSERDFLPPHDTFDILPDSSIEFVCDTLWRSPDVSLAELAADAGYADQAHLQREFRELSGRTPHQFANEMRQLSQMFLPESGRNLQDNDVG